MLERRTGKIIRELPRPSFVFFDFLVFFLPARISLVFFVFYSLFFQGFLGFGRGLENPCFFFGFPLRFTPPTPKKERKERVCGVAPGRKFQLVGMELLDL